MDGGGGGDPHVPAPQLDCPAAGFFPGFFAVAFVELAGAAAVASVAGAAAAFDALAGAAALGVAVTAELLAAEVDGLAASTLGAGVLALVAAASVVALVLVSGADGAFASGGGAPPHATMIAPVPKVARTPAMLETFNLLITGSFFRFS